MLASAVGAASEAQEIEFRKYSNTPVGTNSLAAGYSFASGNVLLDPAVPVVLADLVRIFHPELVPDHELFYYRRLE